MEDKKNKINYLNLSLGLNISVGLGVFVLLGHYIDVQWGEGNVGIFAGIILGFLYGAYEIWKFLKRSN